MGLWHRTERVGGEGGGGKLLSDGCAAERGILTLDHEQVYRTVYDDLCARTGL